MSLMSHKHSWYSGFIFQKQAEDWAKKRKDALEEKRNDLMKKQRLMEDQRRNQDRRYLWIQSNLIIAPRFEKAGLYWIWVVCHSIRLSFGPSQFHFRSISWEKIDRISPNFIYAFILTRSSLGLLHVIFHTFVPKLWPLIYAKILFCSISKISC